MKPLKFAEKAVAYAEKNFGNGFNSFAKMLVAQGCLAQWVYEQDDSISAERIVATVREANKHIRDVYMFNGGGE